MIASVSRVAVMLGVICKYVRDVSVLRRLLFAVAFLPHGLPNLWAIAVAFAIRDHEARNTITAEQARTLVQNLQELDVEAFASDKKLVSDLIKFSDGKPLGIILMSGNSKCLLCGSNLTLRKDCPAPVVVYDDNMGSIPGTHFHKYCTNRGCGFTQYYGYYTTGGVSSEVLFNSNWESLQYFVSSRETVFSMKLLRRFDSQVLLGQMSFKQCAEVYNYLHDYSSTGVSGDYSV